MHWGHLTSGTGDPRVEAASLFLSLSLPCCDLDVSFMVLRQLHAKGAPLPCEPFEVVT